MRPTHAGRTDCRFHRVLLCLLVAGAALAGAPATATAAGSAVVAWGDNVSSQVGIGTSTLSSAPAQVSGLTSGIVSVSAGGLDTLAVKSDGTVVAWGSNYFGQLGDGTTTDRATPVAVSGLSNVIAVAAGETFSLALESNGEVFAWGENDLGQLGDGTNTNHLTPEPVRGLTSGVTAIAAGGAHALALKSNGSLVAWGSNFWGQLGNGTNNDSNSPVSVEGLSSGVTAIAAGSAHSLAIHNGAVVAWGQNGSGQLGNGDPNDANQDAPVPVSGLSSGVSAISAGAGFSLALTSSGSVMSWGANLYGQLGDGTTGFAANTPQQVTGLTNGVTAVAAGGLDALALKSNGTIAAWGKNTFGELGDGTTTNRNTPVAVSGLSGVTAVSAGASHNVELQGTSGPAGASGPAPPVFPPQPVPPTPTAASPLAAPANVAATPSSNIEWAHPALATDPANPSHMAVAYTDQQNCWLSVSTNGGATWTSQLLIGATGVLQPSSAYAYCFNPSVAYGPGGNLFYLANSVGASFNSGAMFLSASPDGGTTWLPLQRLDAGSPTGTDPFAFQGIGIAVDNTSGPARGTVYAQWDQNDPVGGGGTGGGGRSLVIMDGCDPTAIQAYLAGGTLTCNAPVQAGTSTDTEAAFHSLAIGSDGRVYAAWLEGGEALVANNDAVGPFRLLVSSSIDQGRTFSAPVIADSLGMTCPFDDGGCHDLAHFPEAFVSVAAGHAPGEVYVTLEGDRFGHARFAVSGSTDGGATWTTRSAITLAGGTADDQHAPQVAVAPSGRVDVAWYEVVPGSTSGTASDDVYAASSFDHGQTWTAPRKLDSTPSLYTNADESVGTYGDATSIGLVSSDTTTSVAWIDNRNGNPSQPNKNDIFTTAFTAPSAPGPGPGPSPGPGPGGGSVPPKVTGFGLTNKVFVVGSAKTPLSAASAAARHHPKGTTFKYTLNEAATVKIVISARLPGRRSGRRCVAPSRKLRHKRSCTRVIGRGTLTRTSHAGANRVAFSGRIGSRALKPGRYQAVLTATNGAGQKSKATSAKFTVVAR